MKLKHIVIAAAFLVLILGAATVSASGQTSATLEGAGWYCENAGPNNWVHCTKKDPADGPSTIPVKVFSEDGSTFLGTELLIRDDLYNGQPCPQEGGGEYFLLPFGYRACHHG